MWTGALVALVFVLVIGLSSHSLQRQLQASIYHDLATRNAGHVHTISAIFDAHVTTILALRDDLELYDTRGQMWVHLTAHVGEIVFDDPKNGAIYRESYHRKIAAYRASGQLSDDKLTPQLRKMLDNYETRHNAFGEGLKFFYIGVPSSNPDPTRRAWDEYQDSSMWVPDPRIDERYDPHTRPWYLAGKEAGRDRVLFTEPYAERRTKEALVSGATSITVEGVPGTLAGGISIKPIMNAMLLAFGEHAHVTIFSKGVEQATAYVAAEPKYIFSSRDPSLGDHFKSYNDAQTVKVAANHDMMRLYDATRGQQSGVVEWTIGGDERLVAFDTVPGVGWKLYSSVSKRGAMADAEMAQWHTGLITLGGLALLLAIIWLVVGRALRPLASVRSELMQIADTGDLGLRATVVSQDEIGQMASAVNTMLDNTAGPVRELGLRVKQIAAGDLRADIRIPAKGDIAELVSSFNEMTRRLIEFEESHRDASPLTGLPGGVTIDNEVQRRIDRGEPFVFCMCDLDNFKLFNDRYGYSRGNLVLKHTAGLIAQAMAAHGAADDFVGHIGGDDFVIVATHERFRAICEAVIAAFDASILAFYDEEDRRTASITSRDRRGQVKVFPVLALSICAVDSRHLDRADSIRVGEIAAELKHYAKTIAGSTLVVDQRAPH